MWTGVLAAKDTNRGNWSAVAQRAYGIRPWEMDDYTPREWNDLFVDAAKNAAAVKGGDLLGT